MTFIAVSTGTAVVGWFLVVLGGFCMVVGAIGAAKALLDPSDTVHTMSGDFDWGAVIGALLKAGPWGVLMGVGLALFVGGCALVGIKLNVPTG